MKLVLIRPQRDFKNKGELLTLASEERADAAPLHLMQVPLLPVILDGEGMPLRLPNQFLAHMTIQSRSATGDTARTYGESLLSWLRFQCTAKFKTQDTTEEHLALFRNFLANRAKSDGRRLYSPATVNTRVAAVESFYVWVHKRGLMCSPLGTFLVDRSDASEYGWWGRNHRSRRNDSLRVGHVQRLPRVLSLEEISRLFVVARNPYKLMFRWGLVTGLRGFEVCSLRKSSLAAPAQIAARDMALVPIDIVRKGGKSTTAYAPAALVEETHWYCLTERRMQAMATYSDFVFLNRDGRPCTRNSLSREFRRCADHIGSDATLHHLRHTFATLTLGMLESREEHCGPINSVKVVQTLLGHANVTTTEIYLRAFDVSTDEVKASLDFLYGATL